MRSKKETRLTVDAIVFDTLDNWGEWQENAHLSGCASIYQVLAIMLWFRVNESPAMTKQDESAFVLAWAEKIKEATTTRAATLGVSPAFRFLTPLDQVTRIEPTDRRAIKTLDGWVINWRQVDEWLYGQGYSKLCAYFFECATQNTQAKEEWTAERLRTRRAQLEGDGRGRPMQRLEAESGMKRKTIVNWINKEDEELNAASKRTAHPFGGLGKRA